MPAAIKEKACISALMEGSSVAPLVISRRQETCFLLVDTCGAQSYFLLGKEKRTWVCLVSARREEWQDGKVPGEMVALCRAVQATKKRYFSRKTMMADPEAREKVSNTEGRDVMLQRRRALNSWHCRLWQEPQGSISQHGGCTPLCRLRRSFRRRTKKKKRQLL